MNDAFLLTDFQQCTADRIFKLFHSGQRRVLLADEVGLGKTIVARAVIKRVSQWHREELHDDHFKVVYICSNINIASQNARKLGIRDQMNVSESRLSMQHLKIYESAGTGHDYEQLIPLTPATSFSLTKGCGTANERALMLAHLRRLPIFSEYDEPLGRLLQGDATSGWATAVELYEQKVAACAENGSHYLEEMAAALSEKLAAQPDLISEIQAKCSSEDPMRESRPLINRLRIIFAEISLDKLGPDLVIMDEFQRFRDLIAPAQDSEEKLLSQQFLQNTDTKVLLLSATPYKPYSTLEEIAEDQSTDHYHEFLEVMDFLFYGEERQREFHTIWNSYSESLCEISSDSWQVLLARKNHAEKKLYQGICRTERFRTGIIDDGGVKDVGEQFSVGDVLSYDAAQSLLDAIAGPNPKALRWKHVPVDYVKSAPYLLSFMENYQLKKQIRAFCLEHPEFSIKKTKAEKYLLLKKDAIHNYKPIQANNARLEKLREIMFENGAESLLWMPPSRPYYQSGGVFDRNRDFSKVLVFSSWEMVPRMISVMLSYESERLTIGKLFGKLESRRWRGYFVNKGKIERRFGIGRLKNETEEILCLVSPTLAEMFRPEDWLGADLKTLRREMQNRAQGVIEELVRTRGITESPRAGAADLIACIKAIDGDPEAHPTEYPRGSAGLLAEMAIGSPAICAYRTLRRGAPDDPDCAAFAAEIAKEVFVSLFNKAESSAVLDLLYDRSTGEEAYYRDVFRYCTDGNLQAVLDEYAHVLNVCGEALKKAMIDSVADTVSLPIDMQETFPGEKRKMMRCHFAVGYYNAKVSDDTVARAERMRNAFNSPFRPFVLSTTSIGQEGLDFHLYCRKVMHWNLPSNPVDLEQREGRVNRYKCLAVRQNIARKYGDAFSWDAMFAQAAAELKNDESDLVPYWCLPDLDGDSVKIERIVPMYPFSRDQLRYERIIKILSLYRLTLGQPRQEELISLLDGNVDDKKAEELFMNLCPYQHEKEADAD